MPRWRGLIPLPTPRWPGRQAIRPLLQPRFQEANSVEAGELVGWRIWILAGDRPRLHSLARQVVWKPSVMDCHRVDRRTVMPPASDDPVDHFVSGLEMQSERQSLDPTGGNGFWSFKTKEALLQRFPLDRYSCAAVYGTIWQWGEVIEHDDGYRSQYAAIRSLDICDARPFWYEHYRVSQSHALTVLDVMQRVYHVGRDDEANHFRPPLADV